MEQQFTVTIPGQEVDVDDINLVSANGALATDRTLDDLLRVNINSEAMGGADRGVLLQQYGLVNRGLIYPSGSADGAVYVDRFLAVVGANAIGESVDSLRSASCNGQYLQFAPAAANRWDLVYARVDVAVPDNPVTRYVKAADDTVGVVSVSKTVSSKVTVSLVKGVEGAGVHPAIPADAGSAYYLPLGFVLIPAGHTTTMPIAPDSINVEANILCIGSPTGVPNIRPAVVNARPVITASPPWLPGARPRSYIPCSLVGGETRILALRLNPGDGDLYPLPNNLVDDSIDWRNRLFKISVSAESVVGSGQMPWTTGGSDHGGGDQWIPNQGESGFPTRYQSMAQSFHATGPISSLTRTWAYLCRLNHTNTGGMIDGVAATVDLFCDMTDGTLRIANSGDDVFCSFIFWIEATGYYANAF